MMAITLKNKNLETAIFTWLCIAFIYSLLFLTFLNSIVSILLAIAWLIFSKKEFNISSNKSKLMLLFISLYVIGLIGLIYTENMKAGLATLKTQSAILFFPLIFGTSSFLDRSLLKKITTHFLIAISISSIAGLAYGLYNFLASDDIELFTGSNILLFHVFRPLSMGLFCLTAMIIAFENFVTASKKEKTFLYACLFLMTVMIFLLSVRLIIICWLLLMLYFILKNIRGSIKKFALIGATILVLIISGFTIPSVKKQWNELFSANSTIILDKDSSLGKSWGGKALRIAIWKCSADVLKKHWLIGVGTGDVQDSLQQAYEKRKFYFASQYNKYNAHNEYLQITLANGLPGLLILLSCIVYPLTNYSKKFSGNIYLLFLLLFAVISVSESLLEVNKGIIWYSFFNSIFAFGYLKQGEI